MPDFAHPEMDLKDQQIGALLNVVGYVSRDSDPSGFGYTYGESAKLIAERLGDASSRLQARHGVSSRTVLASFLTASELAIVVGEHIEPHLPDDNISHRFN